MRLFRWLFGEPEGELTPDQEPGREVYSAYIREQVDAQDARKTSVEQRGITVITTSGVLMTLLLGLTALAEDRTKKGIPDNARVWLVSALILFFLAAVAAILVNLPLSYGAVKADPLERAVKNRWDDTRKTALQITSLTRIKTLRVAKRRNNYKAWTLIAAMAFQIAAVAAVAVAIGIVLWD